MAIYPIGDPTVASTVLMDEILTSRTLVTGSDAARLKFVANVVAQVSNTDKKSKFLNRIVNSTGKVLLVLPKLHSMTEFNKALPAGTNRANVFTTYSAKDVLEEDISQFALVVLWPAEDVFGSLRNDPSARDIDMPAVLNQANNLIVWSTTNGVAKSNTTGLGTASSAGEVSLFGLIDNKVDIDPEAIVVNGPQGYQKYSTAGEVWEAPRVITQKKGDWLLDAREVFGPGEVVVN